MKNGLLTALPGKISSTTLTDGEPRTVISPINGRKLAHGVVSLKAMKNAPVPPSEVPVT